jgi:hypothetical protein
VRDIATVDFGFAERESFARLDGRRGHAGRDQALGREHHRDLGRGARQIDAMRPHFPPTTVVKITSDMS